MSRPDLIKMNKERAIHNMNESPTWITWKNMRYRCTKTYDKDYPNYGGRGIKVCERWMKFENFLADMGVRPDGMQINRIDNDGNYEPGNVNWVTPQINSSNRRSNKFVEWKGQVKTISDWARETGIGKSTLRHRLNSGWTVEESLTKKGSLRGTKR